MAAQTKTYTCKCKEADANGSPAGSEPGSAVVTFDYDDAIDSSVFSGAACASCSTSEEALKYQHKFFA